MTMQQTMNLQNDQPVPVTDNLSVGGQSSPHARHRKVQIHLGLTTAHVDEKIAPLIHLLNKHSVIPMGGCQEDEYGRIRIDFAYASLSGFLELAAPLGDNLELEARVFGVEKLPASERWIFEVWPDLGDESEWDGPAGSDAYVFRFSVRFPPQDLPLLIENLIPQQYTAELAQGLNPVAFWLESEPIEPFKPDVWYYPGFEPDDYDPELATDDEQQPLDNSLADKKDSKYTKNEDLEVNDLLEPIQCTLVNAQEMNRLHPISFEVPSQAELAGIAPGDVVKVCAEDERFWVEVTHVNENELIGMVDNSLFFTIVHGLDYGDIISFAREHIYCIKKGR